MSGNLESLDKVTTIKKFNSIVQNLLDQVAPMIGTKYSGYFKKLVRVNSLLPIQNFILHGIPHEEKIMNRDSQYFLDENVYNTEVKKHNESINEDKTDYYLMEILNLKEIYLKTDEDSRNNLWDIVTALLLLSKRYQQF